LTQRSFFFFPIGFRTHQAVDHLLAVSPDLFPPLPYEVDADRVLVVAVLSIEPAAAIDLGRVVSWSLGTALHLFRTWPF